MRTTLCAIAGERSGGHTSAVKRAAGIAVVVGALVFTGVGNGGSTVAAGSGILVLQTESNPRLQQILLWHPGTSPQPLGSSSDWILTPQWSPGGRSIAFAEEQGGWDDPAAYDIWTMRADGSGPKRLTYDVSRSNVFRAYRPSWSPNSRQIVFVRETENRPYETLVVVNVRTGHERNLQAVGESPAWGRAGIAYVADYRRIMLVSPAGGRPKVLAPVTATGLVWSSRGVLAALQPDRILLFTAAGRHVGFVRVPFKKTNACGIAWSPDGKRLLVRTSRRTVGLWSVTPAGGGHWRRLPLAIGKSNFDNCAVSWR
jgi:Tol biopolymer transport system component